MIDRIKEPWGWRTPFGPGEEWPVRVDRLLEEGVSEDDVDRWVQTASILHSNGDALDIAVKEGRIVGVRGRGVDRVNKGRVDPKDLFGWQANNHTCNTLAKQCEAHAEQLEPFVDRYGEEKPEEPERLYHDLFDETRSGGLGLLRDLHDLYLMAHACDISWTMVGQAAQGARDGELLGTVNACERQTATQIKWLKTRMKQAAPQALLVAS